MFSGSRPWWLRVGGLAWLPALRAQLRWLEAGLGLAWLPPHWPPERGFLEFRDFLGVPIRAILVILAIRAIIARHTHL